MKPDREQKRLAKERNHFLWSLSLDGAQRTPPSGYWEWCGPLPPECRDELVHIVLRWQEEGLI